MICWQQFGEAREIGGVCRIALRAVLASSVVCLSKAIVIWFLVGFCSVCLPLVNGNIFYRFISFLGSGERPLGAGLYCLFKSRPSLWRLFSYHVTVVFVTRVMAAFV